MTERTNLYDLLAAHERYHDARQALKDAERHLAKVSDNFEHPTDTICQLPDGRLFRIVIEQLDLLPFSVLTAQQLSVVEVKGVDQ